MPSTIELSKGSEPVAGYVLEERIGEGGYGEVWKASAPGGLTKAIKFVYGHLDDARAARELKSLNRIKEVHHPFLLSLERIEVIDGRLVIVTELADESLRDRFTQCRERGLSGIARKELLVYLRDTADALDYLYNSQAVQHLDVKPENLLLVGNRIKVADFGLLRDLHDTSTSLVTGLTPTYSPPELLDGRPNQHSDQYSLAIVGMEMLTGKLPFVGRTPTQLAAQHLHAEPDLACLAPADRFAIGRALSRDPEKRFSCCGDFVDCLMNPATGVSGIVPCPSETSKLPKPARPPSSEWQDTEAAHDGQTIVLEQTEAKSLPSLSVDTRQAIIHPTVYVGIGGTAGRILRHLRRRLNYRLGSAGSVPAVQMLLLDTDVNAVKDVTRGDDDSVLQEAETMLLPLRHAKVYREFMGKLDSISRRWIYNIPRSLQTEGLRALGRIALLDHAKSVLQRLRSVISTAMEPQSIEESCEKTGLTFRNDRPRVCVVASLSGGTGSGMVLDVGYAVRQVLAELCLSDEDVFGFLTHSTPQTPKTRNLAAPNAHACLSELRYFSQPRNEYPGEPARGLAGFRENTGTFRDTYVVHLGDELDDQQFDLATDRQAEYLFLNSLSAASRLFDHCRRAKEGGNPEETTSTSIRTVGLSQLSETGGKVTAKVAELLCRTLVQQWRGGVKTSAESRPVKLAQLDELVSAPGEHHRPDDPIGQLASDYVSDHQLNVEHLADGVRKMVLREFGSEAEPFFRKVVADSLQKGRSQGSLSVAPIVATIDAIVGTKQDACTHNSVQIESLRAVLEPSFREMAATLGATIHQWVVQLVDSAGIRVDGAHRAAQWIAKHVTTENGRAATLALPVQQEALGLRDILMQLDHSPDPGLLGSTKRLSALESQLVQYAQTKLHEVVLASVCRVLNILESDISAGFHKLCDLWTNLNQLVEVFQVPSEWREDNGNTNEGCTAMPAQTPVERVLLANLELLVKRLDSQIEAGFFDTERNLGRSFSESIANRKNLVAALRATGRKVTMEFLSEMACRNLGQMLGRPGPEASDLIRSCVDAATPRLDGCGGAKRLIVVTSQSLDADQLGNQVRHASSDDPTFVALPHGDLAICFEAEGLSLDTVAATLINNRPDYAQLAARLHTRVDIQWAGS